MQPDAAAVNDVKRAQSRIHRSTKSPLLPFGRFRDLFSDPPCPTFLLARHADHHFAAQAYIASLIPNEPYPKSYTLLRSERVAFRLAQPIKRSLWDGTTIAGVSLIENDEPKPDGCG